MADRYCALNSRFIYNKSQLFAYTEKFYGLFNVALRVFPVREPSEVLRTLYVPCSFRKKELYVLPHTVYLCVLCGSENKQRLFPYTTLTDWFV